MLTDAVQSSGGSMLSVVPVVGACGATRPACHQFFSPERDQNVPLRHVDYFELKATGVQQTEEVFFTSPLTA